MRKHPGIKTSPSFSFHQDEDLAVFRSIRQSPTRASKGYVNQIHAQKKMNQSFYNPQQHPNYSPRVSRDVVLPSLKDVVDISETKRIEQ